MTFRDIRSRFLLSRAVGYPLVILFFLIGTVAVLCLAAWWTALLCSLALAAYAVINYRAFLMATKVGFALMKAKKQCYLESEAALREALPLVKRAAAYDPFRGIVFLDLARVLKLLGNYTDAVTFGIQAIEAQEIAWGAEHPETCIAREELAQTYLNIAGYSQAQPLLERSLQLREARREPASIQLARVMEALAQVHARQSHTGEAERLFEGAIAMMRALGRVSPSTLLGLASLYVQQQKLAETEILFEEVRKKLLETATPNPADLSCLHLLLATVRLMQTRFAEAEEAARQSLSFERTLGRPSESVAQRLQLLGSILSAQERWCDAEPYCKEAMELRQEYLAPEHLCLADSLELYADVLEGLQRYHEAEGFAHRARQIREYHSPLRIV